MKQTGTAEALLLLVIHSPRRLAAICQFGLACPLVVIAWNQLAALLLDGFSVALVAFLLMFLYGAGLSLLAVRAVIDLPQESFGAFSVKSKPLGQAIAQRSRTRQNGQGLTAVLPDKEQLDSTRPHNGSGDKESMFPLRG